MRYFVILPNGQRFGPADATLLSQWAQEQRLDANTTVEEEGTGRQMPAGTIPGVTFPSAQVFQATPDYNQPGQAQPTYGQPAQPGVQPGQPQQPGGYQMPGPTPYVGYQRQMAMGDNGQKEYTTSLVLSICGFFCCCFLTIAGISYADKAIAKGHPNGKTAKTVAIVLLVVQILINVGFFAMRRSSFGQ